MDALTEVKRGDAVVPATSDLTQDRTRWDDALSARLTRSPVFCAHVVSQGYRMKPHRHLGLEVLYCRAGSGTFAVDGKLVPYEHGSVLFFRSDASHGVDVSNRYDRWNLCFSPNLFAQTLGPAGEALVQARIGDLPERLRVYALDEARQSQCEQLFNDIAARVDAQQSGPPDEILPLRILELIILLEHLGQKQHESLATHPSHGAGDAFVHVPDILSYIDRHLDETLTVAALAQHFHYSASHVHRVMRHATGCSPAEYIRNRRIERAKQLLACTPSDLSTVAAAVGMESVSHFCRCFRQMVGTTPGTYRELHRSVR